MKDNVNPSPFDLGAVIGPTATAVPTSRQPVPALSWQSSRALLAVFCFKSRTLGPSASQPWSADCLALFSKSFKQKSQFLLFPLFACSLKFRRNKSEQEQKRERQHNRRSRRQRESEANLSGGAKLKLFFKFVNAF